MADYRREKYLMEEYGMTGADYATMMLEQGGACKCCGQIPTGKPLHVDHDHRIASRKIKVKEIVPGVFKAFIEGFEKVFEGSCAGDLKLIAKAWLLRKSVRGLLCWKCNEGLRAFKNRADVCRNAGKYLDDFAATLVS